MKINELLLLENYHITGNACRLFVSGDKDNIEYSVFGKGDTEIELMCPLYVGKDEAMADFPDLKREDVKVVKYGGSRYAKTFGIEFQSATAPLSYKRINELEYTA